MIPKFKNLLPLEIEELKSYNSSNDAVIQISSHNDKDRLKKFLTQNTDVNVMEVVDSRQYTLCHIVCINNNLEMLEMLIDYINTNFSHLSHKINEWVNKKNAEGYTPLHMAAFKGNINLIKYLESLGADRNARNRHGKNKYI